ncbi:MAG: transcriptional repressor LexA [Saccharofermentanales bacterium]|jgi:repressor LexA
MSRQTERTRANASETRASIFRFIVHYISEHAYSPSIREIGRGVGIASTSTVHHHLKKLEEDGLLELRSGRRRAIRVTSHHTSLPVQVPLLGRVAAGKPVFASENVEQYVAFPFNHTTAPGDYFALRVQGDSMIDAAILDGDIVIVEKTNLVNEGDIIVALLEDEATVKTLKYDSSGRAYLHPENNCYEDIPFDKDTSQILGSVCGLIRKSF